MTRILVAGIGNIFNGDDGFGVEVARRLAPRLAPRSDAVEVVDFGIRGLDLIYALTGGCDAAILVDAAARGHAPGTVSVIEPDAGAIGALAPEDLMISGHNLDPAKVLQVVAALGGGCSRIVLVACEPLDCGGEEGALGLTPPVEAAIEPAIETIENLIAEFQNARPVALAS